MADGRVGKFKLLCIKGDKVSIGLSFPTDVPIVRNELVEAADWQTEAVDPSGHECRSEVVEQRLARMKGQK
jgi:sRNA-binding carbon storage regulator CsrA